MAETISDKRVLKKILWTKPQNMWSICKSFLRKEKNRNSGSTPVSQQCQFWIVCEGHDNSITVQPKLEFNFF